MKRWTSILALLSIVSMTVSATEEGARASSNPFVFAPTGSVVSSAAATPFEFMPAGMSVIYGSSSPFTYSIPLMELTTNGLSHANMTYTICTNGSPVVPNAEGRYFVETNAQITVRYELKKEGYYFANGTKESVRGPVTADKSVINLVETICQPTEKIGIPSVQLGIVAQHYPWNSIVDVNYRACFWPEVDNEQKLTALLILSIADAVRTNKLDFAGKIGTFMGTTNVDMATIAPDTIGRATFKIISRAEK